MQLLLASLARQSNESESSSLAVESGKARCETAGAMEKITKTSPPKN